MATIAGDEHRHLFESIEEGFISASVIRDDTGAIVDWRFIDTNKAIERHLALQTSDLVGRLGSQAVPEYMEYWIPVVRQVIDTQQAVRHQQYFDDVERWNETTTFPFGPDRFAVLYHDITDKRRQDSNDAFLSCVTSELATLSTQEEILEAVGVLVGEYLNVSSFSFVDIDDDADVCTIQHGWVMDGVPSRKGSFRLKDYVNEDFVRASQAGQTIVIRDTGKDERADAEAYALLQIGALATIPFIFQGKWIASMCITSLRPRVWRDEEVDLLLVIANRLFSRIERARAEQTIRLSEERYRTVFESLDEGLCFIRLIYDDQGQVIDWLYLETNPAFERQAGFDAVGKRVSELIPGLEAIWFRFYGEVARTQKAARMEGPVAGLGRWFRVSAAPVGSSGDVLAVVFYGNYP